MKIEHLTDIHFDRALCEWFQKHSSGDVVCISGDLIDDRHQQNYSPAEQIAWYRDWLAQFTKPVFICSGNHDVEETVVQNDSHRFSSDFTGDDELDDYPLDFQISRRNWITDLAASSKVFVDGSITDYRGITIGCIGYDRENIAHYSRCDVVLHHLPPSQTPAAIHNGTDWGCRQLRSAIRQQEIRPKLILCGHAHRPKNDVCKIGNTRIINSARIQRVRMVGEPSLGPELIRL